MSDNIKCQNDEICKPLSQVAKSLTKLDGLRGSVDAAILEMVKEFIPKLYRQPEIFPLQDGSLQFEYDRDDGAYLEFEFHAKNKVKMFFADFISCEQNETIDCNINEINDMTKIFFENTKTV